MIDRNPQGQVVYAAQVFNCVVSLALAAEAAASTQADAISAQLGAVTGGGVTCTTFADCVSKLRAGEDIDFDGRSGTIGFDERGDPSSARFSTTVVVGGELTETTTVDIDIAGARDQAATEAAIAAASFTTNLQGKLRLLGFYRGPIDGLWDDEVAAALAAFQRSVGLPQTGIIDAATLRAANERGLADQPEPPTPSTTTPPPTTTAPPPPPTTAPSAPDLVDTLAADPSFTTLAGPPLDVVTAGGITVNGNALVAADVSAANGIIHGVGAVLSPATPL